MGVTLRLKPETLTDGWVRGSMRSLSWLAVNKRMHAYIIRSLGHEKEKYLSTAIGYRSREETEPMLNRLSRLAGLHSFRPLIHNSQCSLNVSHNEQLFQGKPGLQMSLGVLYTSVVACWGANWEP